MLSSVIDILFGCWHKNYSFPITTKKGQRTYVVCLECGREFPYNWQEMRMTGDTASERMILSANSYAAK
jgi:hypothetical protein